MDDLNGAANGDDLVDVGDVVLASGVSLTGVLATVIQLGHQQELERLNGTSFLRRWAADAVIAHVALQTPAKKNDAGGRSA
jgi:hypothetical protein